MDINSVKNMCKQRNQFKWEYVQNGSHYFDKKLMEK